MSSLLGILDARSEIKYKVGTMDEKFGLNIVKVYMCVYVHVYLCVFGIIISDSHFFPYHSDQSSSYFPGKLLQAY